MFGGPVSIDPRPGPLRLVETLTAARADNNGRRAGRASALAAVAPSCLARCGRDLAVTHGSTKRPEGTSIFSCPNQRKTLVGSLRCSMPLRAPLP